MLNKVGAEISRRRLACRIRRAVEAPGDRRSRRARVWVDGTAYGPVATTATSGPGDAHLSLRDADTAVPAGFKLQGLATYTSPPGA